MEKASDIIATMNAWLWSEAAGCFVAYNTSTSEHITNRVFLQAFPLWCYSSGCVNATQAAKMLSSITQPDLATPFGIRSTSSDDPRYTNANVIVPYSNWRGPVWINSNAVLAYGAYASAREGLGDEYAWAERGSVQIVSQALP